MRSTARLKGRWIVLGVLVALGANRAAQAQQRPDQLQAAVAAVNPATQTQPAPDGPQAYAKDHDNSFVRFFRDGEWYFSWGFNREYFSPVNIQVSQPALGNNFTIHGVQGYDEPYNLGEIFTGDFFGPEYNLRIGRFFTESFGIELSLDHTKFQTTPQNAVVTGTIGGAWVDQVRTLNNAFFYEELHNGANHLMVNAVYRHTLIGQANETLSVSAIGKAGVGLMLPHTTDIILGNENDVGSKTFDNLIGLHSGWWQLNGWTTGVEVGFRVVLYKPVYLELTDKVAYSYFDDLPAYLGTIQHPMFMNEVILSLGFTYDGTSSSPWH